MILHCVLLLSDTCISTTLASLRLLSGTFGNFTRTSSESPVTFILILASMDVRCNFMLKAEVFTLTSPSSAILLLKIASLTMSIAKKTALSAASPDVWASLQEETISVRIKIRRNLQCLPLWDIIQVFTAVKKIDLSLPPDLHTGKGLAPPPFPRVSPVAIYTPKFLPKYQLGKAYYVECREEIERNQTSY